LLNTKWMYFDSYQKLLIFSFHGLLVSQFKCQHLFCGLKIVPHFVNVIQFVWLGYYLFSVSFLDLLLNCHLATKLAKACKRMY